MSTDTKKRKYANLNYNMRIIRNELNALNDLHTKTKNSLKNNVIIDKKTIGENNLDDMKDGINSILYDINNSVLPIISRNM